MRRKMQALVAVASLTLAAACAGNQVSTDYSPQATFSKYHTFALVPRPDSASHQLVDERVREAVRGQLTGKGLTETSREGADVLVGYGVVDHTRKEVNTTNWGGWGPRWGWRYYRWGVAWPVNSRTDIDTYVDGTVLVSMVDAKTGKVVWQSQAADVVDLPVAKPDRADAQIDHAVGEIFEKFPPAAIKTASL
jgi:hypothetical protein